MKKTRKFQIPVLVPKVPGPALWANLLEKSFAVSKFSNGGPLAKNAEQEISFYLGGQCEVMVCASNTSGLIASLIAFECRNKKVLVSNYTFAATLNAIHCAGAIPVLSDVDSNTWEISVEQIAMAKSKFPDIYAIVITRVHGFNRNFDAILDFCADHQLKVVIDAAAAFPGEGIRYKTRPDVAEVYSFHATKPLGIGEGGAVVGDKSTIRVVRKSSNFGLDESSESFGDGLNAKMDEFAAARLIVSLKNFSEFVNTRKHFVKELHEIFNLCDAVKLPGQTGNTSWPFFPVKFQNEEELLKFQKDLFKVVQTKRYYFPSMSEGYRGKGEILTSSKLEVSVELARTSLCLPVIPSLGRDDRNRYFNKIRKLINTLS
jgi:dTDP-4-amino-4,6-dideoxygalactose transaminase